MSQPQVWARWVTLANVPGLHIGAVTRFVEKCPTGAHVQFPPPFWLGTQRPAAVSVRWLATMMHSYWSCARCQVHAHARARTHSGHPN